MSARDVVATDSGFVEATLQMYQNPLLRGDVLLFAVAAIADIRLRGEGNIEHIRERVPAPDRNDLTARRGNDAGAHWILSTMWLLDGSLRTVDETWIAARRMIAPDVPRYEGPRMGYGEPWECIGTYERPPYSRCRNQQGRQLADVRNPMTGEWEILFACRNPRHRAELVTKAKVAHEAWFANGKPAPKNNTGGQLPQHLIWSGWDNVYEWASWGSYKPGVSDPKPAAVPGDRLASVTPLFNPKTTDTLW